MSDTPATPDNHNADLEALRAEVAELRLMLTFLIRKMASVTMDLADIHSDTQSMFAKLHDTTINALLHDRDRRKRMMHVAKLRYDRFRDDLCQHSLNDVATEYFDE